MSMRFATAMDRGPIMELHSKCFGSSPAYMRIYYQKIFKPERTFVFTEGEQIRSSVQMFPVKGKLHGKDIKGGMLYAAMTEPGFRRYGLFKELMPMVRVEALRKGYQFLCLKEREDWQTVAFGNMGFKPAFGREMTMMHFTPRNSARVVVPITDSDPMLLRHQFKYYASLDIDILKPYIDIVVADGGKGIMLRSPSGMKIAWIVGHRAEYGMFTATHYFGREIDLRSLVANACRNEEYNAELRINMPSFKAGQHYGMAMMLTDKLSIEDLDDVYPEMFLDY